INVEALRDQLAAGLQARQRKIIDQGLAKARTRDSMQAVGKLTTMAGGRLRIIPGPPLVVPLADLATGQVEEELAAQVRGLIASYRRTLQSDRRTLLDQFHFIEMARKVVGVGSV